MSAALELRGLTVHFKRFTLGPLDLTLEPGRVVGLVGPNGAGKTTTLRCIAGNLYPDGGTFSVFGRVPAIDDGSWKALVGYVPDHPTFYEWMTGRRFLDFWASFYADWSSAFAAELTERFRLDLEERVSQLSTGSRVKLSLVAALAHRPRLALFDEPTAGLDPVVRTEVFEVLAELMEGEQTSIFYSTHILDDLHKLADELVFLHDGSVLQQADKDDLVDHWRRLVFRYEGDPATLPGVVSVRQLGEAYDVISQDGEQTGRALAAAGVESVRSSTLDLEQIAVHIMKGGDSA